LTTELEKTEKNQQTLQEKVISLEKEVQEHLELSVRLQQLQQQTEQLESVLSEKTTLVAQLSSQLSQSQTELTEKKQLIEKLSSQLSKTEIELTEKKQLIEKLSSQLSQSQTELTEKKQLIEKLYNQIKTLENSPTPTPEPSSITKPAPKKPSLYNFEMATLVRYIAPTPTPTELTDSDIGWFD
jgi:chromosome segregation ATPase